MDGQTIVVGTAEPGAIVELLDGTTIVARAEANELGEWIAVPEGLPPGVHDLIVRTTSANGRFQVVADERAAITTAETETAPPAMPDPPEEPRFTIADFDVTITAGAGAGVTVEGTISAPRTVMVRRGDTLWDIAERIYGEGLQYVRILEANRATIPGVRALQPGQILIVPPLADR